MYVCVCVCKQKNNGTNDLIRVSLAVVIEAEIRTSDFFCGRSFKKIASFFPVVYFLKSIKISIKISAKLAILAIFEILD